MASHKTVMVDGTTRANEDGVALQLLKTPKGAATTLTAEDHDTVCEFNTAAGYTYTLPAVKRGLKFRFVVRVTITSSNARVACATGDFFLGELAQATDGTYVTATQAANGTTHLAWEGNGSTTSGIKGDWFDIVGLNDTQWLVTAGYTTATGTEATFWKTS